MAATQEGVVAALTHSQSHLQVSNRCAREIEGPGIATRDRRAAGRVVAPHGGWRSSEARIYLISPKFHKLSVQCITFCSGAQILFLIRTLFVITLFSVKLSITLIDFSRAVY